MRPCLAEVGPDAAIGVRVGRVVFYSLCAFLQLQTSVRGSWRPTNLREALARGLPSIRAAAGWLRTFREGLDGVCTACRGQLAKLDDRLSPVCTGLVSGGPRARYSSIRGASKRSFQPRMRLCSHGRGGGPTPGRGEAQASSQRSPQCATQTLKRSLQRQRATARSPASAATTLWPNSQTPTAGRPRLARSSYVVPTTPRGGRPGRGPHLEVHGTY